jgi:AraC-like DNA-binding protein
MDVLRRDLTVLHADHQRDLTWIEGSNGDVVVHASRLPSGYTVPGHVHRRTQFLGVFAGVVLVETARGRWMVPPGHALLIPPRLEHSVSTLSDVELKSVYVSDDCLDLLRDAPLVLEVTELARSLLNEALRLRDGPLESRKRDLVLPLLVAEIGGLEARPLGLPFPADRRLSDLCRAYVANPSPKDRLDHWAERLAMSRRTFTRFFRQETGVSFVTWRQQASVFACLPRLAEGVPVTVVAMEAGYESAAAFATMFRRMLGTSPRSHTASGQLFGRPH